MYIYIYRYAFFYFLRLPGGQHPTPIGAAALSLEDLENVERKEGELGLVRG